MIIKNEIKKQYDELNLIISNFKGTLKELCDNLGGHNFNELDNMFDLNYKDCCFTIELKDNTFIITGGIEVYDDNGNLDYIIYDLEVLK